MELRDYIDEGIKLKGSVSGLAAHLGLHPNNVTNAKSHQRGIPNDAAVKLAQLLDVPAIDVIAASELATERKAEKREFWLSFVNPAKSARLAGLGAVLGFVTNFVTLDSPNPLIQGAFYVYESGIRFVLC